MLKLELDWAGDEAPDTGVVSNPGDDVIVLVLKVSDAGPAGWPVYAVYVTREEWAPAFREESELGAWLETVYGQEDEDERQELIDAAVVV